MFRTFARFFLPNFLDWKLRRAAKKNAKTVLLCWNRGLGDIALGLAAIVQRIREYLPNAKISVLTRENLKDGFTLLENLEILIAKDWKRGEPYDAKIEGRTFDLIFEKPSPSDWCRWQRRTFIPRLKWNEAHDDLWRKFDLPEGFIYIGVQPYAETNYGHWRNYPEKRWNELFDRLQLQGNVKVLLFGFASNETFSHPMIYDLRGKTSLFEVLSIIKNRCSSLIVPDSGLASMTYYIDQSFPIRLITLWADPNHGILKQGVASPNPKLVHLPLIGEHRDLSTITADQIFEVLFPKKFIPPLLSCPKAQIGTLSCATACIILAGGMGSRLGFSGPKGLFQVLNKTLFQHHLENIPPSMPIAIMTSPQNGEATKTYFEKNAFFGRKILFFEQTSLPLLDEKYRPVGIGPDGNGSLYEGLAKSGILDEFEKAGIRSAFILPIENPLASPFDGALLAHHLASGDEVTIQCVDRIQGESMGALAEDFSIVEYFDIANDNYLYSYAGQALLSLPFLRKASNATLPLRWIRKKAMIGGNEILVWKREKLLFDAFSLAIKRSALCYERETCYAPIKRAEQKEHVEKLLMKRKK